MKTDFVHCKDKTDVANTEAQVNCRFEGVFDEALAFIMKYQLMRPDLWRKFADLYRTKPDAKHGWSGEYWGKMMRGATWVYAYNRDEELYKILRESVLQLIGNAEPCGRISTYAQELEFRGWDMWCRKYVLLGLEYFYEVCPENDLRETVKAAMIRHLDYIVARVGDGIGQMCVTNTSDAWKGANAASILEPVVKLWKLTGKKEYLAFADHIVRSGACAGGESLFELAYRDELPPFRYPVAKAYEVMSCFEGLAEYYRVTREEKWRTAVLNFAHRIVTVEKSVIGCCGCFEELYDGGALRQTATTHYWIMQETCVTVTWMKFALQALRLSGDATYADCIEESFFNAYLGALNTGHIASVARVQADAHDPQKNGNLPKPEVLTFDSYSPLLAGERGQMVGGYNVMPDNTFYGCCACIGSAGIGMIPKAAVMHSEEGPILNLYFAGEASVMTPAKQMLTVRTETTYPYGDGKIAMKLSLETAETFTLTLRVPAWSRETALSLNGESLPIEGTGYQSFTREWKNGDSLMLALDMRVQTVLPPEGSCNEEDFCAYRRGPVMLGADARLGKDPEDAFAVRHDVGNIVPDVRLTDCREIPEARVCAELPTTDGEAVRLIDYSSCGKTWDATSRCAVWLSNGRCRHVITVTRR